MIDLSKHDKDLLAQWAAHPGWEIWNQVEIQKRDDYFGQLAKRLFSLPKDGEIDALEMAFERGMWRGRRQLLNEIRLQKPKQGEGDSV